MRWWWVSSALVLVLASLGHAEDFVCGNGGRPQCADTTGATRYIQSVDPSHVTDPTCSLIPKTQTAAQRTLVQTVAQGHPNGRCHLKVAEGLAVEMDAGEKAVVDSAIQAIADERQAYEDAVAQNDLCSATLDELRTRKAQLDTALQGDIDGITNIATAKAELADMMGRLTGALLKLMECIRGRAGPPE